MIAYLDCFSGVSGDMLLAALIDAGWESAEIEALPGRLGLDGVGIRVSRVHRGFLEAARVEVTVEGKQPPRHLRHIRSLLERADIPASTRTRAVAVFERLAVAEAAVHGSTPEEVHFHEVGAADALVDITGVCLGFESLGVTGIYATALPLGRGTVTAEHGVIPIPAPATVHLLQGVPVELPAIRAELVTPTGAALLVTLVDGWETCPPFTLRAQGLGAGGRDLAEQPNVLRLFLGDAAGRPGKDDGSAMGRRTVSVLETAIDDAPPQHLAPLLPRLIAAGALDAFLTAIVMKKGRPALLLTCLCEVGREEDLCRIIFRDTPTLGVRMRREERVELPRKMVRVNTRFGAVDAKVATLPDGARRLMPEYESLSSVAEESGVSLLELTRAVTSAWESGDD